MTNKDLTALVLIRRILSCVESRNYVVTTCVECGHPWSFCEHSFNSRKEVYGKKGLIQYVRYFEEGEYD